MRALLLAAVAGFCPAAASPIRVMNLPPNTTLRYPVALLDGEADLPDGTELVVANASSTRRSREFRARVARGRFKALMELVPGRNRLTLAGGGASLSLPLRYTPPTTPYVVRLVYYTDQSGDTSYQSEVANDPQDYAARLDTAAKLLQTFAAERMARLGYGRKTFSLELDGEGRVVVHLIKGAQPAAYYHAKDGGALWTEIGEQIRRDLPEPRAKNVAIMAFTRFDPATRQALAHTALGGGDLALFGSAGLFAWPASLQDAPRAFGDATPVDSTRTHDDSCFRGTYWGVAATTLGAVLHEMGHTFGLPHSPDTYEIMSRGFDFLNRAFTLLEPPSAQRPLPFRFGEGDVPHFGPVNAARLAASRWFQPDAREYRDAPAPSAAIDPATGRIIVTAAHGIRVLGINSVDEGEVRSCASTSFKRPPKRLEYDPNDLAWQADGKAFRLVLIDTQGNQVDVDPRALGSGGKGEPMASVEGQAAGAREQAGRGRHRFDTVSLYITPPSKQQLHYYDFYKACGYNALEFCEGGWSHRPDLLPRYYAEMADAVAAAQKKGFRVWILLLAGMSQWKGPADAGSAGTFCALEKDLLAERLSYIKQAVHGLRGADGFEFFAGDPGGDPQGRTTVNDCIDMARQVRDIVHEQAPEAGFAVNLWAIAEWAGSPSPFKVEFWQKQVELSKAVAGEKDFLGPGCGVVFSLDNHYRSLALACYAAAGIEPEPYPLAPDVARLHERGVKPIFGWPYFLVDEVDDGFITPNNVASGGQSQAETRYIRAIIDRGRDIGLDGLVANAGFVAPEALNIYAFGRMCRAPGLTPEALLDEYAGLIAEGRSRGRLARVLRFIENHSNWQNSLPARHRLKDLECGLASASAALEELGRVTPRETAPIPLPEPPAAYLQRLRKRLEAIAAGNIGGFAPIR